MKFFFPEPHNTRNSVTMTQPPPPQDYVKLMNGRWKEMDEFKVLNYALLTRNPITGHYFFWEKENTNHQYYLSIKSKQPTELLELIIKDGKRIVLLRVIWNGNIITKLVKYDASGEIRMTYDKSQNRLLYRDYTNNQLYNLSF